MQNIFAVVNQGYPYICKLIVFSPEQSGLDAADAVEEQDAVQVVHFVLDGNRLETAGVYLPQSAVRFAEFHRNLRGALNFAGVVRHTHAPFPHDGHSSTAPGDFRVDHAEQAMVVLPTVPVVGDIHHADPQRNSDLGSGHADRAGSFTHRIDQIPEQTVDALVDMFDPVTHLFQNLMWILQNRLSRHS